MNKSKENYKGYTLTISTNVVARNGRKIFGKYTSIELAKSSIDAWIRNVECSERIAATPQGKSPNPNVIRK